ncbi:MAG: serine hydrolase [Bacteroidota bacterium]|nr:serine hydrolase [Bacteroidota bacterium]
MKKLICFIIVVNIFYVCTKSFSQSNDTLKMKIDSIANVYLSDTLNAGLTIGIIRKGTNTNDPTRKEMYYYGEVRKGSGIIPDSITLFKLASIGKTLTATILAYYVIHEPLFVKLNNPINNYFPIGQKLPYWLPDSNTVDTFKISLLDLATHHSSIPDQPRNFVSPPHYTYARLLEYLSSDLPSYEMRPLSYKPGTHWIYSNTGFGTLGYVLGRFSSMEYDSMQIKIFCDTLDMPDTRVFYNADQRSRLAVGYEKGDSVPFAMVTSEGFWGAGGNFTSLKDMMNYLEWNMGLKNTTLNVLLDTLHKVRTTSYNGHSWVGLAWQIDYLRNSHGPKYIWKDGGGDGYSSFICFHDSTKTGVMVLANSSKGVDDIGIDILRILNPVQTVGITNISSAIPDKFSLSQNYPNPFNPTTKIRFDITGNAIRGTQDVRLIVYDALGKEVALLVNERLSTGSYEVEFNAADYPSGIYFYSLSLNENVMDKKKMILLK